MANGARPSRRRCAKRIRPGRSCSSTTPATRYRCSIEQRSVPPTSSSPRSGRPTTPMRKRDVSTRDIVLLLVDVAQIGRNQPPGPAREPGRRWTLQYCQNAAARRGAILRYRPRSRLIGQTGQAFPTEPPTPHHRLTVRGIVFTARAIDRVEPPSAASSMIRARNASRCSVVGARTRASSTERSAGVSRTSAALGIIPTLDHKSAFCETGY